MNVAPPHLMPLGARVTPANSPEQHERTLQVNYLSNVLLVCELLPHLEASAENTGHKGRITWVGSRVGYDSPLAATTTSVLKSDESILDFMDDPSRYRFVKTYGNTKFLCLVFFHELVERLALARRSDDNRNKITINMVCPGMTATNIGQYLPIYLRPVSKVMFMLKARTVEQGAWTIVDAAAVVGEESHGKFFGDQKVDP
jgi:NAD(P)-dependent dehydrogenase (short-subunit alcohol dehydrogenase family)